MYDYVYVQVPYFIPKYWALKIRHDERLSKLFKAPADSKPVKTTK